jgi:hypothetical protein
MVRVDCQVVDPPAMSVVTNHDGADQLAVVLEDHETVCVDSELAVDIPMSVIPRAGEPAEGPEGYDGFGVVWLVGPECRSHERSLTKKRTSSSLRAAHVRIAWTGRSPRSIPF